MKTFLLGSAALIALSTVANAADLSPRTYTKAPLAQQAFNWTGFYLSAGGGYGLWNADQQLTGGGVGTLMEARSGGRGYFGTVGGGYDWQFASNWVAGIFADAQFGDIKGTFNSSFYVGTTKNNASYAAGGRLGYLIAPNALSYVNVGYSHADFKGAGLTSVIGGPVVLNTGNIHRDGWFIGGGVENSLNIFGVSAPGWFMKTEYRVAEYNRKDVDLISGGVVGAETAFKPYVQTVSTSLVYRFNSNGPAAPQAPLYTKAPAAIPVNWTGFYLSGGGGYGLWTADQQVIVSSTSVVPERMGGRGYFGTVGGGYDWQFAGSWLAGVFADAQFGDIKGTIDLAEGPGGTRNNLSYAVGARLGYLVAPNVLSYVDGGYSHANFSAAQLIAWDGTPVGSRTQKPRLDGWFIGGGTENSLDVFGISAPGWFIKTEYRLAEYGQKNLRILDAAGLPSGTDSVAFKPYVQTISTSLVYRFNWGGAPISAKY